MTIRVPPPPHTSKSSVFAIDFRERAPAASNSTMFGTDPISSKYTGLAVGVPGEIRGMADAHARWGKLSWKRLFEPSIKLAEGWRVGKELDRRLKVLTFICRLELLTTEARL
jgi:gamma-glutamyltranspeptidase/glutathione hydrolase/leukotriene-C4 hydrolase